MTMLDALPLAVLGSDPLAVGIVILVVGALLLSEFLVFSGDEDPTFRQSVYWSLAWLVLGLLVAIPIALTQTPAEGVTYVTVYLIERTLSLDNLVVFLLIFGYFAVPQESRRRLLLAGIVLALALRGVVIVLGIGLLESFHFVIYLLGALLIVLAWRMWKGDLEHQDPGDSPAVKLVRKFFPVIGYEGNRFLVRRDRKLSATPLLLALASIVAADIAFAVDSIPAAFAITSDPLVIWAANGFALLGLRALFVLVEHLTRKFRYLNQTIAAVLAVVAIKLLASGVWKAPPAVSLGIVLTLFAVGIAVSLRAERE
jgi:tellurite resistance protein TerC